MRGLLWRGPEARVPEGVSPLPIEQVRHLVRVSWWTLFAIALCLFNAIQEELRVTHVQCVAGEPDQALHQRGRRIIWLVYLVR